MDDTTEVKMQAIKTLKSETEDFVPEQKKSFWSSEQDRQFHAAEERVGEINAFLHDTSLQLSDKKRATLLTIRGREKSQMLLNADKFMGDSSSMQAVKKSITLVEQLLSEKTASGGEITVERLKEVEQAYEEALDLCHTYIEKHNPWTSTGKERKRMVESAHRRLLKEMGEITLAKSLISGNRPETAQLKSAESIRRLLVQAKVYRMFKQEDASAVVPETVEVTTETEKQLKELTGEAADMTRLLMLKKLPSDLALSDGEEGVALAKKLHAALLQIPAGKEHVEYLRLTDGLICLRQTREGRLFVEKGETKLPLPYDARMIRESFELNMVENEAAFGQKTTDRIMANIRDVNISELDAGGVQTLRNLCVHMLANRLGKAASFFNNVPTFQIRGMVLSLLDNQDTAAGVQALVELVEHNTVQQINGEEILELHEKAYKDLAAQTAMRQKVVRTDLAAAGEQAASGGWQVNEAKLRDFICDLIYSGDTWKQDATLTNPGERILRVFEDNADTLAILAHNPALLSSVAAKMPFSDDEMKDNFVGALQGMLQMPGFSFAAAIPGDDALAVVFRQGLEVEAVREQIKAFAPEIERMAESMAEGIQASMIESANQMFSSGTDQAQQTGQQQTGQQQIGQQQTEEQTEQLTVAEGNARLNKIMEEAACGDQGQGKFIRLILSRYFAGVSAVDKRSMIASALRAKTAIRPDMTEDEKASVFLGGLLKGAGPLLQKILQGLPEASIPEGLKDALKDMKGNLAPIPEEIVNAQLLGMVERSKGRVTKIEVMTALGAASVGQAFLCKMYGPGLDPNGKEIVVKLLRPDVRNRMMREKELILQCAEDTDAGMRATYEGQLLRIEEELDLTIEAANVERGKIYDEAFNKERSSDSVSSMKLNRLIEPTQNAMVLERAPGKTVDKVIGELKALHAEILTKVAKLQDGQPELDGNGVISMDFSKMTLSDAVAYRTRLIDEINRAQEEARHLETLSKKWVQEGIFGKGFYHGDLHAGNIMIDERQATIIDFGNATQLDEVQQGYVTRMMMAASVGDAVEFRDCFQMLLRKTSQEKYLEKKEELTRKIEYIFSLGDSHSSGSRIGAVLMEAQKLGLELPPAIYNFSQCQLRLQNTVDEMNEQIKRLKELLRGMGNSVLQAGAEYDFLRSEAVLGDESLSKTTTAKRPYLMRTVPRTFEMIRKKLGELKADRNVVREFDEVFVNGIPTNERTREKKKRVNEYIDLYMTIKKSRDEISSQEKRLAKDKKAGKDTTELEAQIAKNRADLAQLEARVSDEALRDEIARDLADIQGEWIMDRNVQEGDPTPEKRVADALAQYETRLETDLRNKDKLEAIEAGLAGWFVSQALSGEKLRTAFDAIKGAHDAGTATKETLDGLIPAFLDAYRLCVYEQVSGISTTFSSMKMEEANDEKQHDFLDIMGDVINQNVDAMLSRLGFFKAMRYGRALDSELDS